jgi:hypothetical protein
MGQVENTLEIDESSLSSRQGKLQGMTEVEEMTEMTLFQRRQNDRMTLTQTAHLEYHGSIT